MEGVKIDVERIKKLPLFEINELLAFAQSMVTIYTEQMDDSEMMKYSLQKWEYQVNVIQNIIKEKSVQTNNPLSNFSTN